MFNSSHFVTDGCSVAGLRQELSEVYLSVVLRRTPGLPNLLLQHADCAYEQRQSMAQERMDKQLE